MLKLDETFRNLLDAKEKSLENLEKLNKCKEDMEDYDKLHEKQKDLMEQEIRTKSAETPGG